MLIVRKMNKLAKRISFVAAIFLAGCSSKTPIRVNETLRTLAKSKFVSQSQAYADVEPNNCKLLIKSRTYVAPMGLSSKNDLKNAARGIDEWVHLTEVMHTY
jgi:hypothetical protein